MTDPVTKLIAVRAVLEQHAPESACDWFDSGVDQFLDGDRLDAAPLVAGQSLPQIQDLLENLIHEALTELSNSPPGLPASHKEPQ